MNNLNEQQYEKSVSEQHPPVAPDPPPQPYAPPAPQSTPKKSTYKTGLIAGIVLLIIVFGALILSQSMPSSLGDNENIPSPTVLAPTQPSIQSRTRMSFATTSAFLAVQESIASLSAQISNQSLEDERLSPPNIDITLGFSK